MREELRPAGIKQIGPALLTRFRAGDGEAFGELYRIYSRGVFRFVLYMTGDATRADEVTQDVFVWLVHHPAGFDAERGELGAYLAGVARKLLQRRQREARRWAPIGEAVMGTSSRGEAALEAAMEAAMLRDAIAALPARYREVVALCDLEGFSYEEAAAALDCPPGTVRSRLHRARGFLAKKLQAGTPARCET
jgi:RNA polymerase sigma-70 factor (ECF subfamily)